MASPESIKKSEEYDKSSSNQNEKKRNKYELALNKNIYTLYIEALSKEDFLIKLRQSNIISYTYYSKQYKYDDLLKILNLSKKDYDDLTKILDLFDLSILSKKFKIDFNTQNKMAFYIKIKDSSEEKEHCLHLDKDLMSINEMQVILIEEINEIKKNGNFSNIDVIYNSEEEENEEDMIRKFEYKIKELDEEISIKKSEKEELVHKIEFYKNMIKKNEKKNEIKDNNKKEKKNEINYVIKIDKRDVEKEIYIFNDYYIKNDVNENTVDIFINNIRHDYRRFFYFQKEGLYYIKLKFKKPIKSCESMFEGIDKIISMDLSSFDSTNLTNMKQMFFKCAGLKYIDFSSFDSTNVDNMDGMFFYCKKLKSIDLNSFNTKNLTNINIMFKECGNLQDINLSSFDINRIKDKKDVFQACFNLKRLKINKNSSEYFESYFNKDFLEIVN